MGHEPLYQEKKRKRWCNHLCNTTKQYSINQSVHRIKKRQKEEAIGNNTNFNLRLWGDQTLGYFPAWSQRESNAKAKTKLEAGVFMAVRRYSCSGWIHLAVNGVRYVSAARLPSPTRNQTRSWYHLQRFRRRLSVSGSDLQN